MQESLPTPKENDLGPSTEAANSDAVAQQQASSSSSSAVQPNMNTLASVDRIRRFCYLGTIDMPVYTPMIFDLTVECHIAELRVLCGEVNATELVECLSSVLDTGNAEYLPRRDEALLVLAIDLSTRSDEKQRNFVRAQFPRLVSCDKDLFLFSKFVKRVQKLLERKTPFSRTVRKAILEWYSTQSLDRLLHMWSAHECNLAMHRELLQRCHYSSCKYDAEIKAALRLLTVPSKELIKWPEYLNPLLKCKENILGIAKLRLVQTSCAALAIVKQLSLCYEHVPRHMMSDAQLVNELLPNMSYEQLLQTWPTFLNLYKPYRGGQCKYTELFFDESKLRSANVQPIRLLLQETRQHKHKKVFCKGVVMAAQPSFMQKLYKRSFGLNKPLGVRLHITLNLEKCYLGKCLTGHWRSIKYLDAAVALAFGFYKSDPQVNVQMWFDKSGELKPVPWSPEMSVDEAKKVCQAQEVLKIKQTLTDVIENALKDAANTYEVFLVIVPAATRGNPFKNSDNLCRRLDVYRQQRNTNAKFIIMSLRQQHASMSYSKLHNEHILELCSISEKTPRLISAFAHDKFF